MLNRLIKRAFSSGVKHSKIAIIGAGGGGVSLAGSLKSNSDYNSHDITLYDKSSHYYYKPGWTMIASGLLPPNDGKKLMRDVIPGGIGWNQNNVVKVDPENNTIYLDNGESHTYEQLVISSGIQFNFDQIKGLKEALRDDSRPVGSIYHFPSLNKLLDMRDNNVDKALFTQPPDPITCGGAPQKIVYTTSDYWKQNRIIPKEVKFFQAGEKIFGVPFYAEALQKVADGYGIDCNRGYQLREIKEEEDIAVFEKTETGELIEEDFDYLHVTPYMSGLDYLEGSGLEDALNFVDVHVNTLQNQKYPNVWGLGDGTNLPTSKTFSAVAEQVQIVSQNLTDHIKGRPLSAYYDGYTGCPVLVGQNKVLLAEFKYGGIIAPSFERDQRKPRKLYYFLKKRIFPFAAYYLSRLGFWKGRKTVWDPSKRDHTNFQKAEEAKIQ